ncbi:unnamed protein product, partial [Amoebophrya sp. A120]
MILVGDEFQLQPFVPSELPSHVMYQKQKITSADSRVPAISRMPWGVRYRPEVDASIRYERHSVPHGTNDGNVVFVQLHATEGNFEVDMRESLFEQLVSKYPSAADTLRVQRRMNEWIAHFSKHRYYRGELETDLNHKQKHFHSTRYEEDQAEVNALKRSVFDRAMKAGESPSAGLIRQGSSLGAVWSAKHADLSSGAPGDKSGLEIPIKVVDLGLTLGRRALVNSVQMQERQFELGGLDDENGTSRHEQRIRTPTESEEVYFPTLTAQSTISAGFDLPPFVMKQVRVLKQALLRRGTTAGSEQCNQCP